MPAMFIAETTIVTLDKRPLRTWEAPVMLRAVERPGWVMSR